MADMHGADLERLDVLEGHQAMTTPPADGPWSVPVRGGGPGGESSHDDLPAQVTDPAPQARGARVSPAGAATWSTMAPSSWSSPPVPEHRKGFFRALRSWLLTSAQSSWYHMGMESAASGSHLADARPPVGADAAPLPGTAGSPLPRRSAQSRPWIRPVLRHDHLADLGYPTDHPYVRTFWVAVIGPGAVADLLRLAQAARRGAPIRRPIHLSLLAREGLAGRLDGRIWVRPTVPPLSVRHVRRLPPPLRFEHARLRWREGIEGRNPPTPH